MLPSPHVDGKRAIYIRFQEELLNCSTFKNNGGGYLNVRKKLKLTHL